MVKEDERFLALEGDDKYRLEAFDEFMVQDSVGKKLFCSTEGKMREGVDLLPDEGR